MSDLEQAVDLLTGEALPFVLIAAWLAAGIAEGIAALRRRRRGSVRPPR